MISSLLLIVGLFFIFTSTIGIIRFPDLYTKIHPAGILESLGMPITVFGLMVKAGFSVITLKLLVMVPVLWIASSMTSYTIAHVYYLKKR